MYKNNIIQDVCCYEKKNKIYDFPIHEKIEKPPTNQIEKKTNEKKEIFKKIQAVSCGKGGSMDPTMVSGSPFSLFIHQLEERIQCYFQENDK